MKRVIFWGATGHAKVLREFIGSIGYELVALFDNNDQITSPFPGIPIYHGKTGFARWQRGALGEEISGLVAIGGARGRDRHEIQNFLTAATICPIVAVHPRAFVASDAELSNGCQVLAHASIGSEVQAGEACIINTAATVDHECRLAEGVHIAPGATLAGAVSVGAYTMIGAGAVVLPRLTIGRNTIVGAGAVVTKDIPDNKVVYGNPGRVIRENLG